MNNDIGCSIHPYFQVAAGKLAEFKRLGVRFVERTRTEPGCLYYGFSYADDLAHCREGYASADALLVHLQNVSALIDEALKIAAIARLEVHAPAAEIAKLRGPLASFNPQFFTLEYGIRK